MNRVFVFLQKYLLWAFPFVVASMVWSSQYESAPDFSTSPLPIRIAWEVLSFNLVFWFAALLTLLVLLILRTKSGDQLLMKLSNLKERDEREAMITGLAAKSSFVATLGLIIFLMALATLSVEVKTLEPQEIKADGHSRSLSIGANFSLIDHASETKTLLPLSRTGILMLLLIWLVGTYSLRARRELKDS